MFNLTIRKKLLLALIIPMIALIFLGGRAFLESRADAEGLKSIDELAGLSGQIGALVHETQKERGMTAAFYGSKGSQFGPELAEQRNQTDQRAEALRAAIAGVDAVAEHALFAEELEIALAQLREIESRRSEFSAMEAPLADALSYYTSMNGHFLDSITQMTNEATDKLASHFVSYVSFLKSKERAGIERAVLANTFASDKFGPGMFEKFIAIKTAQELFAHEARLLASPENLSDWEQAALAEAFSRVDEYRALAMANAVEGGFGIDPKIWFATITKKINVLHELEDLFAERLRQEASGEFAAARTNMYALGVSTILIILFTSSIGVFLSRSITNPLLSMIDRLRDIADGEGDLTQTVDEERPDELGELGKWFNLFVSNLRTMITNVAKNAHDVASSATEIAASAEELSAGMQQQQSQTATVSSAVEEMSASIAEVASKASCAVEKSERSGDEAASGGEVVERTVSGMEAISAQVNESAIAVGELGRRGEQIGDVIEVINDIADQTNLLALNAAIEAARAGEHGRGFAVVADEVRKLAERTTRATEEVTESIQAIQSDTSLAVDQMQGGRESVADGVKLAERAGASLQGIVAGAQEVAEVIRGIAASAEQQALASTDISRNVEAINAVTNEAAEGVRQSSEAAADLSVKAEELQEVVGQFKVA